MARFNTSSSRPMPNVATATSPLRTGAGHSTAPDTTTFEGAPAWNRDARTDLFLRATSSFHGGEKTFYEDGEKRDETLRQLTRTLAVADFPWLCRFAEWLRAKGNIRTAALMIAADAVKTRLDDKKVFNPPTNTKYTNRWLINAVCQRPDEPGELLAYWLATYGRKVPKAVKRGLGDAARRLYNERSLLKYDTSSHAVRFADVLELCHPSPDPAKAAWQGDLFKHAIDRRHDRVTSTQHIPASLTMLMKNAALRAHGEPDQWLNAEFLRSAGMTWEDALSAVGSKVDKAKLWEAMIPSMGYMALLRNLRNFDETGVSNKVANSVVVKLVQEDEVRKSRQLPFRFYSAYRSVASLRWGHALETALDLCLPNIPTLPGRTLVLVDTSGSMQNTMSGKSAIQCVTGAALFGSALALKNPSGVDLYQFASRVAQIPVPRGGSVLKMVSDIETSIGRVGHGTEMAGAIRATYAGHDRVIILSDMQAFGGYWGGGVATEVPASTPVYAFNLMSYTASPMPTGGAARFDLGGLTDATFSLIPRLEAGLSGMWPWEADEA